MIILNLHFKINQNDLKIPGNNVFYKLIILNFGYENVQGKNIIHKTS